MIPVQQDRRSLMISSSRIVTAVAVISLSAILAVVGCSSKKTSGIGDSNGANIGDQNVPPSENSLTDWQKGLKPGGPLTDIHFAYNEYTIEPQDGSVLRSNATWLSKYAQTRVQVEGHCDERGSEEYNIALGAKRAEAAKDYLVTLGIADSRISTISYGKELPICTAHDENCWAQNRRDHFAVSQ